MDAPSQDLQPPSMDHQHLEIYSPHGLERRERDLVDILCADSTVDVRHSLYERLYSLCETLLQGRNPTTSFADKGCKAKLYQYALDFLHHKPVVEEMLIESGFYSRFRELDLKGIMIVIMAFDFLKHNFNLRPPRRATSNLSTISSRMELIADALWKHRVRLSATLAKMRVIAGARTTTELLPESSQAKHLQLVSKSLFARITNINDAVQKQILLMLSTAGIVLTNHISQLSQSKRAVVHVTRDLLAFTPDCRMWVYNCDLMQKGILVIEDIHSYNCVSKISQLIENEDPGDVIVTHCNSGVLPIHFASQMRNGGTVFAFGVLPMDIPNIQEKLLAQSLQNVQLISAPFTSTCTLDDEFADVKIVYCNPPCSLSSVEQPIDFIMQEGDQYAAQLLSPVHCGYNPATLSREQKDCLTHALSFQAEYVAYDVHSVHNSESSDIVEAAIETHSERVQENSKLKMFECENCPEEEPVPSSGFLCILKQLNIHHIQIEKVFDQQPPEPGPSASTIIEHAIKKGLISGEGLVNTETASKPRKKKRSLTRQENVSMTFAAKQKIVDKKMQESSIHPRAFR